ncbi:MAG: hypothetical protein ACTHJX_03540 [Terriglobales bacterium]
MTQAGTRPARSLAAFSWRRWGIGVARYVLCFAILPNAAFWLLGPRMGIATPGWVSLDGLGLGLLALFVPPGWVLALFAGDFLLDIVYSIRATYSTSYTDILFSVRYMFTALAGWQLLEIAGLVILTLIITGAVWWRWRPRLQGRERWLLMAVVLLAVVPWAVVARGERAAAAAQREQDARLGYVRPSNGSARATYAAWGAASVRSPLLGFYHAWRRENMSAWLWRRHALPLQSIASAASATRPARVPGQPNVVLVLVESWGEAEDPQLRQALVAPFNALSDRYQVTSGMTAFHGATGDGELRELCDRALPSGMPLAMASGQLSGCRPWQFAERGYRTLAVDSAADFWPGGASWYRLLGFQQVLGYNDLRARGLPEFIAGTFRSTGDPETAALLPRLLRAGQPPRFIFFLTVGAHLPVHLPLPLEYNSSCSLSQATTSSPTACGWFRIESATLAALAQAAAAPQLPPTVFLLVGDHAPPFADSTRRFFSPAEVPYILLTPRSGATGLRAVAGQGKY